MGETPGSVLYIPFENALSALKICVKGCFLRFAYETVKGMEEYLWTSCVTLILLKQEATEWRWLPARGLKLRL